MERACDGMSAAQLELEQDSPAAVEDVESGHVAVPLGPRWGASYAMQLKILFTRRAHVSDLPIVLKLCMWHRYCTWLDTGTLPMHALEAQAQA